MDFSKIRPDKKKVLAHAREHLSNLISDAIDLDGICSSAPNLETMIENGFIGGTKFFDKKTTLNMLRAWETLFDLVCNDKFAITKSIACQIHEKASEGEFLGSGYFRLESLIILGTNFRLPRPESLDELWEKMCIEAENIMDIYEKAIFIFLEISRNQFFLDLNKRIGKVMMNGILLMHGYPIITIPPEKHKKLNNLMLEFYVSHNHKDLFNFLTSCTDPKIISELSI